MRITEKKNGLRRRDVRSRGACDQSSVRGGVEWIHPGQPIGRKAEDFIVEAPEANVLFCSFSYSLDIY
jgi:hypothetical protein